MTDRVRTLVLDANGAAWRDAAADTVFFGLAGARNYDFVPERFRDRRFIRLLRQRYDVLGYTADWREAICASPALDVRVCNITNLVEFAAALRRIREYELVIVMHSAAGDSLALIEKGARRLRRRAGKLVVFLGNEFDLIREKLVFLRSVDADYVCSQLSEETARWLYEDSGARVVPMPHALNPMVYRPGAESQRPVSLGFAGANYPLFIGDVERAGLLDAIRTRSAEWGLSTNFRDQNVPRREWADLLARCNGTVGAESGTYYLDRYGELMASAKAFVAANPGATFDEVHERFFAHPALEYMSGKCVSSRHFEAIGTKTCQILVEGEYNGILEPGMHYIGVRKDLGDLDEAVEGFKDESYRREITERAHEYVLDGHTHAHRVAALLVALGAG